MEVPMHIRPEENYYVFSKEITFSLAEKKKLISERPFFSQQVFVHSTAIKK
jgi:hypothetical protein